jgi:uncharacterized iron-regulated membrane protein
MKGNFRQSMAWLHTWTGLVVGWVLYFVFFTGTIGYFYVEVDRWMRPEQPLAAPDVPLRDVIRAADAYLRREAAGAASWSIDLEAGRSGMLTLGWTTSSDGSTHQRYFDRRSGTFAPLRVRDTGGGYALYRMHWGLHYLPGNSGYYFVGMCTMVMLIALVTGVITHKRIFADLLVFRPGTGPRAWLDGHVMVGTLALPFLLGMTFTGLAYYRTALMPAAVRVLYGGDEMAMVRETYTFPPQRASNASSPTIALERVFDASLASGGEWGSMRVDWPGDAAGEVHVYHSGRGGVLRAGEVQLHFSAVDGRFLRRVSPGDTPGRGTQSALEGLHEAVFAGPALRWILFLCGAAGAVMVATGLILWTIKRRAKAIRIGTWGLGHRLVERLNIGTIAGLPVATGAYFCANRLLPIDVPRRAEWEMHALFITWALMLAHAVSRRPARAWIESLSAGALVFALLPVLNAMTTDRHLGITLPAGVWALAAVDLMFLAFAAALAIVAALTWKHA